MARNKHKKTLKAGAVNIAIVVDGYTEVWYFKMLRDHFLELNPSKTNLELKPELPSHKNLERQYEFVIELAKEYDKVFWLIDLDVILKETKENKQGSKSAIADFKDKFRQIGRSKKLKNVEVLVVNPCLEFWYLLHFKSTGKSFSDYESLRKELVKIHELSDYEKTEKYYKKPNHTIYQKLLPYQRVAIAHAKSLGRFDIENHEAAKAEIYRVFEFLDELIASKSQ